MSLLVLLLHPEVQRKAQSEIDRVTQGNRLPTFEDRAALPYVECVVKECMRWHPVVPLGALNRLVRTFALLTRSLAVPHRVMQDDIYNGMYIPKGSTVIANCRLAFTSAIKCIRLIVFGCRAISRDESVYKDPDVFHPERFIGDNAEPVLTGPVFGYGRR